MQNVVLFDFLLNKKLPMSVSGLSDCYYSKPVNFLYLFRSYLFSLFRKFNPIIVIATIAANAISTNNHALE